MSFLKKISYTDLAMGKSQNKFFSQGLKFQCQGSGKCCVSRGEYGFVYMTQDDRKKMAEVLKMTPSAFTRKYCEKTGGIWHLKANPDGPECLFLNPKNQCEVYNGRPVQCRTWPFWPENMNTRAWRRDVVRFCPGVGQGKVTSPQKIQKTLEEQEAAEAELFGPSSLK